MEENNDGFYNKSQDEIVQDKEYNNETFGNNDSRYNIDYAYKTGTYTYPESMKKHKKSFGVPTVIISVLLAAIIGAVSAAAVVFSLNGESAGNKNGISGSNVSINIDEEASSIAEAVAKKCTQSVVGIRTTASVTSFFGGNEEQSGSGSGVVYSEDGYIITNYHVIESAVTSGGKIEVFVGSSDSKAYNAEVIGYHISSDLALIKIKASGLTPIEFADSGKLSVGQYAVTIGAPGGLEFMGSVTYGIISGLDRVVSTSKSVSLIQTDAAINPGNSGGALLDESGKLIGINSSKIVAEEFEGMGFAIPSNTVKERCEKILSRKDSDEAYIGITVSEKYTSEVLNYYGYPSGAVVLSVDKNSPASKSGIKRGDIITKFNGTEISEYNILGELISDLEPGEKVEVEFYRDGRIVTVSLTAGSNS